VTSKIELRKLAEEAYKTCSITKIPTRKRQPETGDGVLTYFGSRLYKQAKVVGITTGRPSYD
jgi:hypothetical protein